MSVIRVPTTFNIDLEFEIPEFHRRMFAWMIDVLIQIFYLLIAFKIFRGVVGTDYGYTADEAYDSSAITLMIYVPVFLYHVVCEITMNGQSLGKKILGIRVVNENGGRPGISQFIIRWLIRTGDLLAIVIILYNVMLVFYMSWFLAAAIALLLADIILVASGKKSQRIGDILAHTILVRTGARGSVEDTVFMEVADNYVPVFPQIMKLSDKDINAVKSILDSARRKSDFQLAEMATEKIKNHLKINTALSPFDFLETVMKDYNYLSVK
jgi:uncharacterized RDD family membrane protein YckC